MNKTQAIQEFLSNYGKCRFLCNLYNPDMEVQVNVAQDNGVKVQGEYKGRHWVAWESLDGSEKWKSFRVPWKANSVAEYNDSPLRFDLEKHAEGIGMTGWNWNHKKSLWVGFDFDSIANHKAGLTDEVLNELKTKLFTVPYVTILKSTSGKGLHIYIFFADPVDCENHTQHAALARSILSTLSADVGINLHTSVDVCGAVLWCWHRKQEGTDGLTLLKEGGLFNNAKIPINWKEQAKIVDGTRRRVNFGENFELLFSTIKFSSLDADHLKLIKWIKDNGQFDSWWDSDYNMLVCHTIDLATAHNALGLLGIFRTNSSGSSRHNCFAFPERGGVWSVRRYSPGVKETGTWRTDPSGWTKCKLNATPDLPTAAYVNGGYEHAKGGYYFKTVSSALEAIKLLGTQLDVPELVLTRSASITERKDGKLVLTFPRMTEKTGARDPDIESCVPNKKGDVWERVVEIPRQLIKETQAPDHICRNVISEETEGGWYLKVNGNWIFEPKGNVVTVLSTMNDFSKLEVDSVMARCIMSPWYLVNVPFEDEYIGDRKWNKNAAALSVKAEEGFCDTWNKVFHHCGKGLDESVQSNSWCRENAILTGADYLRVWTSFLFQRPNDPLPYIFFFGDQNCGKSTLHEALSLLFKKNRGYIRSDNALINQSGFNAELSSAVLCIVEETNLNQNKEAHNRIKDWVTGKTISINEKYKTTFDIANTTHWIQCANDLSYCPIFPGDTRVIVIPVPQLSEDIPKNQLFALLEKEKAAFLYEILNMELPDALGRLSLPILKTQEKSELEHANSTPIQLFMQEKVFVRRGQYVTFKDFFEQFQLWLPESERGKWNKNKVGRELPRISGITRGRYGDHNEIIIGNITFFEDFPEEKFEFYYDTTIERLRKRAYE
jgi:hypothetical protein